MVALFVLATFLFFLAIDSLVQRSRKNAEASEKVALPEQFMIPRGYFFSPKHTWLELLGTGAVRVGVDDFVRRVVGSIEGVALTPANTIVKQGEPIIVLGKGNRSLSFASPISGRIVEVNELLRRSPKILESDPYIAGWVAVVEPENLGEEIKTLTIAEDAVRWLRREVSRFRDFIQDHTTQLVLAPAGRTMLDGGIPMCGALEHADLGAWKAFEQEFLAPAKTL